MAQRPRKTRYFWQPWWYYVPSARPRRPGNTGAVRKALGIQTVSIKMIMARSIDVSALLGSFILLCTCKALAAQQGLAAHYSFDEGSGTAVHDLSGNGNDGVIHGCP